ncbi:class I SAM-dependent methyltransferase [bacterium BMS3Abin03]|jgi:ubiquinone/menaquinone biosynthesis C-methylase UbiE|nr:class I SAM-dependent methyltransferase [bacterium BMS3Abin03]
MARTKPFDDFLEEYEQWFAQNHFTYLSELEAVKQFIPDWKKGIEIGIGSGRFALPLNITEGIEPSNRMLNFCCGKGLKVVYGIAEQLPIPDSTYEFALMVTTICFVDDVLKSFKEVKRILKQDGTFIIGLVDKNSPLGIAYQRMKENNKFYRLATFYSTDEIINYLKECQFRDFKIVQTVFGDLKDINQVQRFKPGHGEGGFVVIKAVT